ncbi:TPA: conjugal transfer protein TraB [Vibrio vulnificus]|uniref:IncF plasmid conjugative transfer pilus assembly protein TraB n=2 Tax=Vibrio vulnificus TaxID=672 RepID=A0A3Q0KYI7_VIBVU|nr:TrbI/VirB10 family protein [Vibrio vulnificus]AAO07578.1 IncF plasmid conjugative transfer pilus assembly protein TraB [Vibrio vulnificus CMCP6]ANN29133.1 IncF plasmid conjugative transfer pilus assembly protein TraB [Vibrio vulnificus]AXX62393.1 IncF plasmid conjugative transfer pilus assembly protein TraB [Vibrio vulnificus]QBN17141.1 conjugal transfer protein TraB [Vibrio vulnificus]WIL77194.1 TrbI/VirB10 family protein [Vibrio vulnificus]
MLDNWRKRLFSDTDGDFEQGGEINQRTASRNNTVTIIAVSALLLAALALYKYTRPPPPTQKESHQEPVEFGAIIEQDFVETDNQSALSLQQKTLSALEKQIADLTKSMRTHKEETERKIEQAKEKTARLVEEQVREEFRNKEAQLQSRIDELEHNTSELVNTEPYSTIHTQRPMNSSETFGQHKLPPRPIASSNNNPDMAQMQYQPSEQIPFNRNEFDSFNFFWESDETTYHRTTENYVPTGTFVTAVVTGGADTNAGVLGQGDTTPVVFQTIHEGILPNGEKSKLSNCTITGSSYGEISSSRGIIRTNRLSCIQDEGHILDVAIKGTAFNFGRNGIRGTTILKNGEIVQMAGIAGILNGIGETGQALSQTTSTSAFGTTSSINSQDAALNLLGNATSSVGEKLSDYYIGLAELYHPIVEINPGAVVNIVFLEGFPLDPLMAEEYERQQLAEQSMSSQSNQILDVITNAPLNPLAKELSTQGIEVPPTPFGRK